MNTTPLALSLSLALCAGLAGCESVDPVAGDRWNQEVDDAFANGDAARLDLLRLGEGDVPLPLMYSDCPFGMPLSADEEAHIEGLKTALSPVRIVLEDEFLPDPVDFCAFFGQRFKQSVMDQSDAVISYLSEPVSGLPFPVRFFVGESAADDARVQYFDALNHKIRIPIDFGRADVPLLLDELKRVSGKRFEDLTLVAVPSGLPFAGQATFETRYGKSIVPVELDDTLAESLEDIRYLVVTEQNGDFPAEADSHIADFVRAGGRLIVLFSENDPSALNKAFGINLEFKQDSFNTATKAQNLAGVGELFASGPADLTQFNDFDAVVASSLPEGGQAIYSFDGTQAGVVAFPVGDGTVIIIGEAKAFETEDAKWVQLMRAVLDIEVSPTPTE